MTVTVTDNRTPRDEADSTTGWAAAGGSTSVALGTADPNPVEAGGHIASTASNATTFVFHTGTSLGTGPHLLYCWVLSTGVLDTRANGGLMFLIGDGTNRIGYHIGGADVAPFRSDSGEAGTRVGYMCLVIDTAQLATWPYGATVLAGSRANLEANLNAITQLGGGFKTLAKAVGGAVNIWVDIIRHGVATDIAVSGLTISGGTSGAGAGKFREIAVLDRDSGTGRAHGVIRELGEGVFGVQGTLRFGDQASGSSWFEDKDATVVFEKRDLASTRYKIAITDNGTGTTTFRLGTKVGSGVTATGAEGCTILAATGVGWEFDAATDTDVTDVFIYGSTFKGASGGVKLRSTHEFIGGLIASCGTVEASGATMVNTSVIGSIGTRGLLWNVNTDTDGKLDGMIYSMGASGHGIELGSNTPDTITLRNVDFTGYGADGTNNAALYNNSGKAITVNIVGGTTPTVRNGAGASTTVVSGTVTVSVTAAEAGGAVIENARVFLRVSSGGPFPHNASVTIVNSGTTATVTHTAHGLATGDKVLIKGASHLANNGVFSITRINDDSYSYTMGSTPGSNPTGTIVSTFVFLYGLTDVNGLISMSRVVPSNQPVIGWARKSSSQPFYKEGPVSGTVSNTTGAAFTAVLSLDE